MDLRVERRVMRRLDIGSDCSAFPYRFYPRRAFFLLPFIRPAPW